MSRQRQDTVRGIGLMCLGTAPAALLAGDGHTAPVFTAGTIFGLGLTSLRDAVRPRR